MLDISKELYEYLNGGKKGINLRQLREQEQQNKDKKPVWKSTGASNMPNWDKPSKYQMTSNIKAKVYTGLQPEKRKERPIPIVSEDKNLDQQDNFLDDNRTLLLQETLLAELSPNTRERLTSDKKTLYQYMLWQCNK